MPELGGNTGIQKDYQSEDLIVYWEPDLCTQSTICVKTSPDVFDPKRRPWIDLDQGTTEEIIKTVEACPSGALKYERK